MSVDIPNKNNFCGGAFPDWLEINLIDKCNGRCHWCIEKEGYHPEYHANYKEIADMAIKHGAKNIILLGGEPLLYEYLQELITNLSSAGKRVWITTNGGLLSPSFIKNKLLNIYGINISIHHYNLIYNLDITGVKIDEDYLRESIDILRLNNILIRMNCNCILKYIDSLDEIIKYINWAKLIGAMKIRFAELKNDDENFVDLAKILNYKYGLNDNPFRDGCNSDAIIYEMPVNFRQMCGLQTTRRVSPSNPQGIMKKVLYYDGILYDGWQKKNEGSINAMIKIIQDAIEGKITAEEATDMIMKRKLIELNENNSDNSKENEIIEKIMKRVRSEIDKKIDSIPSSGEYCCY